jgi:hypothetical protein
MLAGEVQRRQERISELQVEVGQYFEKIAALDSAMALADDRINPKALGAVKATAERYGGWGGLTRFLEAEIRAAGAAGIDTHQLALRAACKFAIPLDGPRDLGRYKDTISWILRVLRKRRVIETTYFSRGGHKPSIWRQRERHDTFDELLSQRDVIEGGKNARP